MLSPTASYAPSYQLSSNAHVQPEWVEFVLLFVQPVVFS
jgi:hypothetical protein